MPRRTLLIFANGIMNNPGSAHGWTDRAVTWVQTNTDFAAEKFEYFAGPLTRRLSLGRHARDLADLVRAYWDWHVHVVAHSNGCEIAVRAVRELAGKPLAGLVFLSPACDGRMDANGLNGALDSAAVGRLEVLRGGSDRAGWWAAASRILTLGLLGYGTMMRTGPVGVAPEVAHKVTDVCVPDWGHSTMMESAHFGAMMAGIVRGAEAPKR